MTDLWRDLASGGFLGVLLPEKQGGGGAGLAELAGVLEETAAAGRADDDLLLPVDDLDEAVVIDRRDVPGVQPRVRGVLRPAKA